MLLASCRVTGLAPSIVSGRLPCAAHCPALTAFSSGCWHDIRSRPSHRSSSSRVAMSATVITTNVEGYAEGVKQLITHKGPHYILFSADDVDGQPWCPDCQRTVPAVKAGVATVGGSLLEVLVGLKPAWKSQDHPFRTSQELLLTGIPTLIAVDVHGQQLLRIGSTLEAANSPEEARQVVDRFLNQTVPAV